MSVQIFSESVLTPQDALDLVGISEGNKDLKSKMLKTFQKANRRIQNVRKSGLSSPAVQQIISERGERGYTYFSGANLDPRNPIDWEQLKYEYGRAISFLNNPTSSATGARQYIRYYQNELGVSFDGANKIIGLATEPEISENGDINIFHYSSILENIKSDVMQEQKTDLDSVDRYGNELEEKIIQALENEVHKYNSGGGFNDNFLDRFFMNKEGEE
jgi:hypothetical protein